MATKYICLNCSRRFIDWGAKKLNFKCPDCEESPLEAINFEPVAKVKSKPSLKRMVSISKAR